MKAKHTPGPWFVGTQPFEGMIVAERGGIAVPFSLHQPPTETELANAHLIAAAPEMLAALKLFQTLDSSPDGQIIANKEEIDDIRLQMSRAIIKAEGEET